MASFNDEIAQLESNFQRRTPSYMSNDVQLTAYEQDPVGTGNIQPVGFLADEAIDDLNLFAATIRPPAVVDALPALPDSSYPVDSYAFLTTTSELYLNVADVWTLEDGSTITNGTMIAGLVRAGAISTAQLAADAVIANVANVGDTVVIDDTGITISDGALTFLDDFGSTVLTGAGFGATWVDFLDAHVYNHSFRAGTTNNITANTVVSDAEGANYALSLSTDVPYWIVTGIGHPGGGSGTFKRVADTAAVSGFALEWDGDQDAAVIQDIPISPGQVYSTYLTWKWTNSGGSSFFSIIGCEFRDNNHSAITGETVVSQSLLFTDSSSGYVTQGMNWSGTAPATARYLRVIVESVRNAGNPNVRVAAVNVDPINVFGPQRVVAGSTSYDAGTGISWVEDSSVLALDGNASLFRITMSGINGSPTLYIANTTDATLAGNDAGLIIGDISALNVVFDGNEIMARNNGANSTLFLQHDGGDLDVGASGSRLTVEGGITIIGTGVASGAALTMGSNGIELTEMTPPGTGGANTVRIYADDSAGTTRLRAVGPGGVRVTLATF